VLKQGQPHIDAMHLIPPLLTLPQSRNPSVIAVADARRGRIADMGFLPFLLKQDDWKRLIELQKLRTAMESRKRCDEPSVDPAVQPLVEAQKDGSDRP
jgi:hypothetical protein